MAIRFHIFLFSALTFGVEPAPATEQITVDKIKQLPHYRESLLSPTFLVHLQHDKELYIAIQKSEPLARQILSSPLLQQQLLMDIQRTGNTQKVLAIYLQNLSPTTEINAKQSALLPPSHRGMQNPLQPLNLLGAENLENLAPQDSAAHKQAQETLERAFMALADLSREDKPADSGLDLSAQNSDLVHVAGNQYKLGGLSVWDMNYVPTQEELTLDSNGWPRYLNVPQSCPSPRANTQYLHEAYFNFGGGGDSESPFSQTGKHSLGDMSVRVNSYFEMQSLWYYTSLRIGAPDQGVKSQEVSYPFISPHIIGTTFGANPTGLNWARANEVVSISYCPGDFSGHTPEGEIPLNARCKGGLARHNLGPQHVDAIVNHAHDENDRFCVVEPGKRYFHNYRPLKEHLELIGQRPLAEDEPNAFSHSGRSGTSGYNATLLPPYSNVCLSGRGKGDIGFPINFPGGNYNNEQLNCGRQNASVNGCDNQASRSSCYDVTGKLQPVTFQRECISGNLIWTKGFQEKALSNFACETFNADGSPHYRSTPICAAHRNGEMRKQHVTLRGTSLLIENLLQCQYDKQIGRYDWHLISSHSGPTQHYHSIFAERFIAAPNGERTFSRPPHKQTCSWEGRDYPLGTSMIQNSKFQSQFPGDRSGEHVYICMQRAPEPALPRFSHSQLAVSPVYQKSTDQNVYSVRFENPPGDYKQAFSPESP